MSEKTEAPTEKKKDDSAKKGQVFHPKGLCDWLSLSAGIVWIGAFADLSPLLEPFRTVLRSGMSAHLDALLADLVLATIRVLAPLMAVVILTSMIVTLTASRFRLATQALVPDFTRLNPAQGFGRIFSMRTVVESLSATAYCVASGIAVWIVVHVCGHDLFAALRLDAVHAHLAWTRLAQRPVLITLACLLPVSLAHSIGERITHTRELRMEKHEVKRENKDLQGNPEVRARRRDLLLDMLDGQSRHDIEGSRFVLANPTHLAVGIYVNDAIVEWPFVSIKEKNRKALAVIAYAESIGVPVIRDRRVARAVYETSDRYGFVAHGVVEEVTRLLKWLNDVEQARTVDPFVQVDLPDAP